MTNLVSRSVIVNMTFFFCKIRNKYKQGRSLFREVCLLLQELPGLWWIWSYRSQPVSSTRREEAITEDKDKSSLYKVF